MTQFSRTPYEWPTGKTSAFCFTVDVDAESPLLWNMKSETSSRVIGQMEQRLFGPDIARSRPGKPPSGVRDGLESWFWDKLTYFL